MQEISDATLYPKRTYAQQKYTILYAFFSVTIMQGYADSKNHLDGNLLNAKI